jgi:hypothetical protein
MKRKYKKEKMRRRGDRAEDQTMKLPDCGKMWNCIINLSYQNIPNHQKLGQRVIKKLYCAQLDRAHSFNRFLS